MRIGVCGTASVLPQVISAGADYMEFHAAELSKKTDGELARLQVVLAETGIKCEACAILFPGTDIPLIGEQADAGVIQNYLRGTFKRIAAYFKPATVIFGEGQHDKEQRTVAKNVNFGTFYGLFPRGLQRTLKMKAGLNMPLSECEKIIANLKAGYPDLTRWQEAMKALAARNRYVETWLGRRRYLPDITSYDWGRKSFAERCALNTPIQGTAADILKLALGRIITGLPSRSWLPEVILLCQWAYSFPLPEASAAVLLH